MKSIHKTDRGRGGELKKYTRQTVMRALTPDLTYATETIIARVLPEIYCKH